MVLLPHLAPDGTIRPPKRRLGRPGCMACIVGQDKKNVLEREKRNGHILTATMRSERLPEQSILVRNLSHRGIGARTSGSPPIEGEEVMLQLDGRAMIGRVRWVRGDRFGIHLRDPIGEEDRIVKTPWAWTDHSAPAFHVAERFKPVAKAWRPSVTGFSQASLKPKAKAGR